MAGSAYSEGCSSTRYSFQGNLLGSQWLHVAHGVCSPVHLFLASSCTHALHPSQNQG